MEENNENKPHFEMVQNVQTNNSSNNYKKVPTPKTQKVKTKSSFGKSVLIPFCSGILGATLVVGICFSIPDIKDKLIGKKNSNSNTYVEASSNNGTVDLVSLSNYSDTSVGVASKVLPSIVGIKVQYSVNTFFNRPSTGEAEGSGVIISEDGYILTNNHVVASGDTSSYYQVSEANKITVTLFNDSTEYEAKIIGTDAQTDLAVIKIEKTGLSAATLGDSDSLKVGETVFAFGNPLGMQSSVTSGIVSAVNREVTDSDGQSYTLIQTDAAINSGNSGGALVNSKGEVIGINTMKINGTGVEGMGFAIPINSTKSITEQLISDGKVKRPYIGITGREVNEQLAEYNNIPVGIYVVSVEAFSAAEKAGLKIGDVIVEADGTSIKTMDDLNKIKNSHNIGDTMRLKINRNGSEQEVILTLQEQP